MVNLVIRSGSLRMGGIERVLIEVLQNLDREKYNISLFIEDDSGKENVFLKDIPKDIDLYFLKPERLIRQTESYRNKKKNLFYKMMYEFYMRKERKVTLENTLKNLEKVKEKYGEIDVFLDYDWGARRYINKIKVKKKIIWIHSSISNLLKKKSKIERFGRNIKNYDKVVTICDEMKKEAEELYPFLKGKIEKCYNPFNFERIIKLSNDYSELNEEQKKLIKDDYIVAVSRLDLVSKDYVTLIQGYKLFLKNNKRYKLYIVGGGSDREKILDIIKENGLEKQIILLGQMKNPYVWMKNAKLFVHSSFYEGFGLVLVEAMICGKVVLSSNCPVGPTEVLEKNSCGFLFKTGDSEDLSEKLLKLTNENLELYEERIKNRIEEFRIENVMKEYDKVILE